MGNDIETGSRSGILLRYSVKSPSFNNLEVHRNNEQPIFMCCIKCFNMQVFIYKKKSEKKILYTNLLFSFIAF